MSNKDKHIKQTLYEWCIKNNRQDILDRWDYELNSLTPKEIGSRSEKHIYLKCPLGKHPSELYVPGNYTSGRFAFMNCTRCNSFGEYIDNTYGKDFLSEIWDYNLNQGIDPYFISKSSHVFVWLKCLEKPYHGSYKIRCDSFTKNHRCPICASKIVHPLDSFGQFGIDNIDPDFCNKYWGTKNSKSPFEYALHSNKKVWIKCNNKDYHGEFLISCTKFVEGRGCPYCINRMVHPLDSLATKHPNCIGLWSELNDSSPYEHAPCGTRDVYWKCESGIHEDYMRPPVSSAACDFRCPKCSSERTSSFLQVKVSDYIKNNYTYKLTHERECSLVIRHPKNHYALMFDNLIEDLRLIVEVHGSQHFNITGYTQKRANKIHITPEQELHKRKVYDRYKKFMAYIKGYHYLEIPYTADDKDESYKKLIDNKIASITK